MRKNTLSMLELQKIHVDVGPVDHSRKLLHDISLHYDGPHFGAIVGPSGCGKSTLLKVIAGLMEPTEGTIHWHQRNVLVEEDIQPHEMGYVPQFSIIHEFLTVRENIITALKLRVKGLAHRALYQRADELLARVGLSETHDRPAKVLSGGQKRRLALALEMVSDPALLLCDEVTSGLDPKAEDEIVHLLHHVSRDGQRLVLSVTHSLRHLALYDSVTVLYEGRLAYQGRGDLLLKFFSVENPEDVFPKMISLEVDYWEGRWARYCDQFSLPRTSSETVTPPPDTTTEKSKSPLPPLPGILSQFWTLFARQMKLFWREPGRLGLQLALLLLFPGLVVLFALDGLPQIRNQSMSTDHNIVEQLRDTLTFTLQSSKVGSLVSGLVMLQVILLTLIGSNNAAREIVAERFIFEKEKLGGLHPSSYLASKIAFLLFLVGAQSLWMTIFVKFICQFPGDLGLQFALLFLVNAAMTMVCLGISSWARTNEQASLISIYLVGFQLPLSGALLTLPESLGLFVRPWIASYWSWSGLLQTMRDTRFYDLVQMITETPIAALPLCFWVLLVHCFVGIFMAYLGCLRSRWE